MMLMRSEYKISLKYKNLRINLEASSGYSDQYDEDYGGQGELTFQGLQQ